VGYRRLRQKSWGDLGWLVAATGFVAAWFMVMCGIFAPRFLGLFPWLPRFFG
jgi:hypothetical protein